MSNVSEKELGLRMAIAERSGPIYVRIQDYLRDQVEGKILLPGSFLPPEDDLARESGVSVGTIKKALVQLAEEGWIDRTRGRGTQVATRMANGAMRKPVLVLLGSIKRTFFADIYEGIRTELLKVGCQSILHDNEGTEQTERAILTQFGSAVAGVIAAPCVDTCGNHAAFGSLLDAGTPLVFVDRNLPRLNVDAVMSDNVTGGFLATRHLLELGHRRIAVMPRLSPVNSVRDRIEGCRRALAEAGIAFDPDLVCGAGDGGYEAVHDATEAFVRAHSDITAIFVPRDDAAWGCTQRLADMGLRVPADISVVGFGDDAEFCQRLRPRLTTVRANHHSLGVEAARLLIERMRETVGNGKRASDPRPVLDDRATRPRLVSVPVEMVVRESTAPPPARVEPGKDAAREERMAGIVTRDVYTATLASSV